MLRVHFTDTDLVRTRIAAEPHPLWEICVSLHRFQARHGRWAYADWHRTALARMHAAHFTRTMRTLLLPLVPRATYFPDFLTPPQSEGGLDGGLEAILATPRNRVTHEVGILSRTSRTPSWAPRLADPDMRKELVRAMRTYYDLVIAPYSERARARVDAERAVRARAVLDEGGVGVLRNLGPCLQWAEPVLHTVYPEDRDLHLGGRGLLLIPSYFSWGNPVALADTALDPVLIYSLHHESHPGSLPADLGSGASLTALLGRSRATVLRAAATGATTGELARAAAVSAPSASRHTTALRDNGLITSHRQGMNVLHTLTPLGAALLRASTPAGR